MSAVEPMRRLPATASAVLGAALLCAPVAVAEPATQLEHGIATLRAAGPCDALRHDALVQRVAEISNQSTEDYRNHDAQFVPVGDPLLVLQDFGSDARRAVQLQGHGPNAADAIKGALLQGHTVIGDCSYDTFGTSVIRNPDDGYTLVVAVLAGH